MDGYDASRQGWTSIGRWTLLTIVDYVIVRSWLSPHLKRHRTAMKFRGRTPRSRSDRTAIAAWLNRDCGSCIVESMARYTAHGFNWRRQEKISLSTPDCLQIVAWLWPRSSAIVVSFEAKLKRNHRDSEVIKPPNGNHFHDPSFHAHDRIKCPSKSGLIFPLKTGVFSLLFS